MATEDQVKQAIGCLGTVYPQFVAKELASLTDSVFSAVQGFTDPLAAIADLNIDSIIDGVAELSEGDVFDNLGEAAVGLSSQYVAREAKAITQSKVRDHREGSISKRIQEVQDFGEGVVSSGMTMISLFNDMPYAVAQRMCATIIRLDEMKIANLACLRKHIVQLANAVLVLAENKTFVDDTLADLAAAKDYIKQADAELTKSQPVVNGSVKFDQKAFERARQQLILASKKLTPDKDGTSILDATDILTSGSVAAGQINRSNAALVNLVIPSLANIIEVEVSSVVSQVEVINFFLVQLTNLIANYRQAGTASKVKEQRSRATFEISSRLNEMCIAMELAIERGAIRAASGQMLLWSSRVKTAIATMDELNQLSLQEGSTEGPAKAAALETAFSKLLTELTDINVEVEGVTVAKDGVEDPLELRDKVLALTAAARRFLKELELGTISENRKATIHEIMVQTAGVQTSVVDASATVAAQQIAACEKFNEIDLAISERYDQLLDSMRQVGLDRAEDLLSTGQFTEFLSSSLDTMTYLGAAINCLTDALGGVDDTQTRQQIIDIRDDMIARRANSDLAAADSSDQGRDRLIDKIGEQISGIQKNAKTIEAIVTDLKNILEQIGGSLEESFGGFSDFLGNLDRLSVGGGGHLSSLLEEVSEYPNQGVVEC